MKNKEKLEKIKVFVEHLKQFIEVNKVNFL